MKKRKILLTALTLMTTLILTGAITFGAAKVDKVNYTHDSKFSNNLILDGIDVSYAQGGGIDWSKVKRAGMDYAFIRVGARSYSPSGRLIIDDYYERNIEQAYKNGVQVGIYFFSQATNELEARAEAKYAVKLLEPYREKINLPVIMDYEFAGGSSGRLSAARLTKSEMTKNAEAFMKVIEDADYETGLYANLNFLRNSIYAPTIAKDHLIWLAQYNDYSSYAGEYNVWQYTSSGSVFGIGGRVDCNFWYLDTESSTSTDSDKTSIKDANTTLSTTTYTFTKFKKQPSVTVTKDGSALVKDVDYKVFYVHNVMAGTAYAKISGIGKYTDDLYVPFTIKTTDISPSDITVKDANFTNKPVIPEVKVMYKGTTQKEGIDYKLTASNEGSIGEAKVTITGIRNFHGSVTKSFEIKKGPAKITTPYSSYTRTTSNSYFTLKAEVNSEGHLTYSSSDDSVVSVTSDGRVNIVGAGLATITIRAAATSMFESVSKTIDVTVEKSEPTMTVSRVTQVKSADSEPFNIGAKTKSNGEKTYTTSNEDVATVDSEGNVTVRGGGEAIITVTAAETKDFYSKTREVKVIVTGGPATLTGTTSYSKTCIANPFTLDLKTNSSEKIEYVSSDDEIVTVDDAGKVTVKNTGLVTITATVPTNEHFEEVKKEVTIRVRPHKQAIRATNPYSKHLRVYFDTDKHVTGYQVRFSTNKNFSNSAVRYVTSPTAIYRTYRIYNPGKTYYVKTRAYKTLDNGTKIYGYYSSVKAIRVK